MEKRQPLLISDAGETGQLQGKNENIFSHHIGAQKVGDCWLDQA